MYVLVTLIPSQQIWSRHCTWSREYKIKRLILVLGSSPEKHDNADDCLISLVRRTISDQCRVSGHLGAENQHARSGKPFLRK